MTRRVLVIGGSLGGLLAAHLLRHAGWHAVVFERNEEALTGRGVGLGTHPQLIAALRRAGIAFDASMGITVAKVVCLDRAGNIMVEQPTARTMSAWSRLYRALRDSLPVQDYRLGKKLRRIEQNDGSVTAIFEVGSSERGDLLVGADGIRSTVRAQFLPQVQPIYAGYVAWRAVLDEARVPREAHRDIFELSHSACPKASSCSVIWCRAMTATPFPGAAVTTSFGIAPSTRRSWMPCAPMHQGNCTAAGLRRRSFAMRSSRGSKPTPRRCSRRSWLRFFCDRNRSFSRSSISNRRHWRSAG